ncbi:MAG: hypothetical protein RL593_744, partial [Pseudomonadota bacterium]
MVNVNLNEQTKKPVILKSINKNFMLVIAISYCLMTGIASAKNTAYITNQGDNTVSVIDIDSNKVIKTISVAKGPVGVA